MKSDRDAAHGLVLIAAPLGKDAELAAGVLQQAGIETQICHGMRAIAEKLGHETAAVVVADEALVASEVPLLLAALDRQPAWSDIPLIILTSAGAGDELSLRVLQIFGPKANVTLLERPLGSVTLVTSIEVALRARRRQFEVRDLIRQRDLVLASISDAFSSLDRDWRYVYVNEKVAELAGIPKDQLIGRSIWEVFPQSVDTEFYERCHRAVARQEPDHFELFYEPWNRWLETRIYPTVSGLTILRTDITERKKNEAVVQRAKEVAEEANRAKDHFLAMLSHELRTPLTPVLMTLESLRRDPAMTDSLRHDLEVLHRNVELEALLIDDLLDLTRIAHGKLELHNDAVDIHTALDHALSISAGDLREKELTVTRDFAATEHYAWGDSARLQQVFWNLVKNAAKFTPHAGRLDVRTYNDAAHQLIVEVEDTGMGISPEFLPRIFDAFEQGGQIVTSKYGGLGLGLAISKRVIDLHGGEISASSAGPNRGSLFRVKLKAMETSLLDQSTPFVARPARPATPARILLVEDHVDTARALVRILKNAGYEVSHATTLKQARETAAKEKFDLLISDLGLPDGSGLELMPELRQRHDMEGIALSGFGTDDDVAASKAAGFIFHLIKPVDWERLEEAIATLISARAAREPAILPQAK